MIKGSTTIKILIAIFSIYLSSVAVTAAAQTPPTRPSFPSCKSPQGYVKVYYPKGTHGIPGDFATYTGSDTVYTLSEDTLTQCLCTSDERGIQTNWWRISSLSFEEINALKKLKWIYVPNGAEWGLQEGPYMAKSNYYSCGNGGDDDDDNEDSRDENESEDRQLRIGGQVLGTSTYLGNVLGLASTGNSTELFAYVFLAAGSLVLLVYYLSKTDKLSK